jgi:hypothetical protein
MNQRYAKAKFFVLALVIAALHYAIFSVNYVESEIPGAGAHPEVSRIVKAVLSFPLAYLGSLQSLADWFPVIIVMNSILWGLIVSTVILRLFGQRRAEVQ